MPLQRFTDYGQSRCGGAHGKCGFRRGHHVVLDGCHRTRKAAKYIKWLADSLADEIVMQIGKPWLVSSNSVSKRLSRSHMLDIFGGTGGVGKSCANKGVSATIIDTSISGKLEVTKHTTLRWIYAELKSGRIGGVMLATPCSSFSLAVSRSGRAIRSKKQPRGLENLTLLQEKRIQTGNKTLDVSVQILRWCQRFGVAAILENPRSSYLWYDSEMQRLTQQPNCIIADVHQCSFGARWRKETRFAFFNFVLNSGI